VLRLSDHGAYVGGDDFEVLLPQRYVSSELQIGDLIEVFVHRDSEDRPVATTEIPLAQAGEFACLEVKDVNRMGAFLDWGLDKDLLLPFAAQATPIRRPGKRIVVHVHCDPVSGRMVAATRFNRYLSDPPPDLRAGQPVELLPYERTDLGLKVIVDQSFKGLLYLESTREHLSKSTKGGRAESFVRRRKTSRREPRIGETVRGYVSRIREDGRIDVSLDPIGTLATRLARDVVLEALQAHGGRLDLGDKSDPADIRARLDLSKKAFKKALGALYREGRITMTAESIQLVTDSSPHAPRRHQG
jgi:hypothetical protein